MIQLAIAYALIIFLSRTNIRYKTLYRFVAILFGVMGFCLVLYEDADLVLHFRNIDTVQRYGFDYFDSATYYEGLFLYKRLILLVSKLPYKNFLPCITAFIGYIFLGKLVDKVGEYYQLDNYTTINIYIVLICLVKYDAYVNGIRTMLAFTIVAYAIFVDLIEKKHRILCLLTYILMTTVHPAVSIFIVIRYVAILCNRYNKTIIYALLFAWSFFSSALMGFLSNFSNIGIISTIISKIYSYTEDSSNTRNIVPNLYYSIMMVVALVICVYFVYMLWKMNRDTRVGVVHVENEKTDNIFEAFVYLSFAFMLGSAVSYHIFLRISNMIMLMAPVILGKYLSSEYAENDLQYGNKMLWLQLISLGALMYGVFIVSFHMDFGFQLY